MNMAEQDNENDIELRENLFISEQNVLSQENEKQPFAMFGDHQENMEGEKREGNMNIEDMSPQMSPTKIYQATTLNDSPHPKTTKLSKIESKADLE